MADESEQALKFMETYGERDIDFYISTLEFKGSNDDKLIFSSFICGTFLYKYGKKIKTIMINGNTVSETYINSLEMLSSLALANTFFVSL